MSLPELAAKIISQRHNVLVSDTCILLDAIRGPIRDNGLSIVEAALRMDAEIQSQSLPFTLVLPSLFAGEWQDNVTIIREEVTSAFRRHHLQSQALNRLHQWMRGTPLTMSDVTLLGFETELEQMCNRIIAHAEAIAPEDAFDVAAMRRLIQRRAPSSEGKPEPKDCRIFEETLALGRELRQQGFAGRIVFASSNTTDYGTTRIPRSDIKTDLDSISGEFAQSLNYAYHIAASPLPISP